MIRSSLKSVAIILGGFLYPANATTYEMPKVVVRGKKNSFKQTEEISTIETIQNGFKMISSRNIDQETMQVYVDGIPVQNGGLPINLALFDSDPTTSRNQSLGEIIYASEKPKSGQYLNMGGMYGSYNTYNGSIGIEGGTEKTQGSVTVSQNGMNGIQTFAHRLQTAARKERDKEVRHHLKGRLDHQAGDFIHTFCSAFHDGDFSYKTIPSSDFDLDHPRWKAREQFSVFSYKGLYVTKTREHSFLMGYTQLTRKDLSQDAPLLNMFKDKNFYMEQNNKFIVNTYYATDINASFLKNIYKSDYAKNQVNQLNIENNHYVTFSKTKGKLHIKGIGVNTPDRHMNAMASVQQEISLNYTLCTQTGYYHRLPLLAQKYHPFFKNPHLKSEKAFSAEVGHTYSQTRYTFKQTFFYIYIKDYIDLIGSRYENARFFKTFGIENAYTYTQDQWQWALRYVYTNMKADKKPFYARKPKHKADINISYQYTEKLTIKGAVRYFGNHVDINAENYIGPLIDCGTAVTTNIRLQYQYSKNAQYFLGIDNLFNKKYEFPNGYRSRGFFIYAGVDIKLFKNN